MAVRNIGYIDNSESDSVATDRDLEVPAWKP